MRSRYSAFAAGLLGYLRDTWHLSVRPPRSSSSRCPMACARSAKLAGPGRAPPRPARRRPRDRRVRRPQQAGRARGAAARDEPVRARRWAVVLCRRGHRLTRRAAECHGTADFAAGDFCQTCHADRPLQLTIEHPMHRNLYTRFMKTTLDLNDQLLATAKALAAQQRTSLTRLIEEGLQLRLRAKHCRTDRCPEAIASLPWTRRARRGRRSAQQQGDAGRAGR